MIIGNDMFFLVVGFFESDKGRLVVWGFWSFRVFCFVFKFV